MPSWPAMTGAAIHGALSLPTPAGLPKPDHCQSRLRGAGYWQGLHSSGWQQQARSRQKLSAQLIQVFAFPKQHAEGKP